MAFHPQRHWRNLTAACLAVLAAGFLLPTVIPQPKVQENRKLAAPPARPRTWAELEAWPQAMDAYVADNFPARAQLIAGLNYLRYRMGVSGSKRVLIGRDGWLFFDNDSHFSAARNDPAYSDEQARDWLQNLAGRSEWLKARGAHYLVLFGSDKEVIEPRHGPSWYRGPDPNRAAALLARVNDAAQAGDIVDPAPALQQQARWGLEVYDPFETHWTGLGAYTAYLDVMQRLQAAGVTDAPRPLSAFREVEYDPAKPRNLSQMLGIAGFVDADYPQFVDPTVATHVTWLTPKQAWTAPQVIDTGRAGKPVLLLLRDSFSLALLPFLEGHFSRIVIAHNQDGAWRPDLVERFRPNVVITEVIESGAPYIMSGSPSSSETARARIAGALAQPHRESVRAEPPPPKLATHRIDGGQGDDSLRGTRSGGDIISGYAGDDTIVALHGDNVLRGGRGNDVVTGGDGRDWISGDRGDDTLTGGRGADVFRFDPGAGDDLITDFSIAEGDRVELPPGVPYTLRQQGADAVIELAGGGRLTLRGVRVADLPTDWLIFH